jgi:hypothetical protein
MRYLLILLLTGCASDMVKVAEPSDVAIYWIREKPGCQDGCTSTVSTEADFSVCRITALEGVADAVLGREFRRCFGFARTSSSRHPFLAGSPHDYGRDLVKVAEPRSVLIHWKREAPTSETCVNHRLAGRVPQGCARVAADHSVCRITAHEWVHDAVLGHELRHCFGWEHEADLKWRAAQPSR